MLLWKLFDLSQEGCELDLVIDFRWSLFYSSRLCSKYKGRGATTSGCRRATPAKSRSFCPTRRDVSGSVRAATASAKASSLSTSMTLTKTLWNFVASTLCEVCLISVVTHCAVRLKFSCGKKNSAGWHHRTCSRHKSSTFNMRCAVVGRCVIVIVVDCSPTASRPRNLGALTLCCGTHGEDDKSKNVHIPREL